MVEGVLVAVRRVVPEHDLLAFVEGVPARRQLDPLGRRPPEVDDRRAVADDLLDRRRHVRLGVVDEELLLVGMARELPQPVGDRVARRLVAGSAEEHEERPELRGRQPLAVDLGLHQCAGDVVLRVGQPLRPELLGVVPHVPAAADHVLDRLVVLGVETAEEMVGAVEDVLVVLAGDAHHVADDPKRHRGGDLGDEVDLTLRRDVLHDLAGDVVDVLLDAGDHARREPLVHEEAQLRVPGRVHVDHRPEHLVDLGRHVRDVRALARDEEVGVAAGEDDIVVPGEGPVARAGGEHLELRFREEGNGLVAPQQGEALLALLLGQLPERGVAQVDVVSGTHGSKLDRTVKFRRPLPSWR